MSDYSLNRRINELIERVWEERPDWVKTLPHDKQWYWVERKCYDLLGIKWEGEIPS